MEKFEKTEKVSVNMNIATLSQIDLLVDNGYYSNRSDFINQAVRQTLDTKQDRLAQISEKQKDDYTDWFIGICSGVDKKLLDKTAKTGRKCRIVGYGLLYLSPELDELLLAHVGEIKVKGKVICSDRIKAHFHL